MADFSIYRETALPGTLQPNSVYLIAPPARPDFVEMYVTGSSAAVVKRVVDITHIQSMIDAAVSGIGGITVVGTIAERNALNPTSNMQVLVLNAAGDPTVSSGSATYVYRLSNTTWYKISESESQDVVLAWTNITGRPSSSVAEIDDAVAKRHTHANKTQLDKVGEDAGGHLTYNGQLPVIGWNTTGW